MFVIKTFSWIFTLFGYTIMWNNDNNITPHVSKKEKFYWTLKAEWFTRSISNFSQCTNSLQHFKHFLPLTVVYTSKALDILTSFPSFATIEILLIINWFANWSPGKFRSYFTGRKLNTENVQKKNNKQNKTNRNPFNAIFPKRADL